VTYIFYLLTPKLGHVTRTSFWRYLAIMKCMDLYVFEIFDHKVHISWPVARRSVLPWQPFCAPLVATCSWRQNRSMKLMGPPGTELRHIFAVYIMCLCDLDLWPFDLEVMPGDATRMFNPCTKFELDLTYCSIVRTTTMFLWPPT